MVRSFHLALLLPALAVQPLCAQNAPAPAIAPAAARAAPANDNVSVAASVPAASKRIENAPSSARAISPEVAAQLAASRPKFSPTPPPKPEEDLPDLREIDKPKNTIVRLPKYVVVAPRPPIFRERDIYTRQGLANLAMRRYFSETDRALNRFTLPLFSISNSDRALAMYAEDERLKNMADVADNTNMVMKSDAAAGTKMKDAAQQTFIRWSDFGWQGGGQK
jgi:hypothetical protein